MLHSLRLLSGKPAGALAKVLRGGVLAPNAPRWLAARTEAPNTGELQRATYCRGAMQEQEQGYYDEGVGSESGKIPINELVVGQTYTGTVKSIVAFGAFVDIGSTSDGLVHISEIADQYVRDVNEFVSRGDTVDVVLLKVVGDSKLSLSMKATLEQGDGGY